MFVRVTSTPKSPRKSVKVVENKREGLKVKQYMLFHVGIASDEEEIEKLKQLGKEFIAKELTKRAQESKQQTLFQPMSEEERLRNLNTIQEQKKEKQGRKKQPTLFDVSIEDRVSLAELVEENRIIEGFHDVAGYVFDELKYDEIFTKPSHKSLLKDLVLMRIANPVSKLKTQRILEESFQKKHSLDAIYRLMDKMTPKIDQIKQKTFQKTKTIVPENIDILFFDCTTLYFESTQTDELRKFGYSKDHRFNTAQIVLALASNSDGLPIGYEIFEGNKAEVKTLLICLENWKKTFKIGSVCFVADRAMMSDSNLTALENASCSYIIAGKLKSFSKSLQAKILNKETYHSKRTEEETILINEFEYNTKRLIVSHKTLRAKNDAYQREQIVGKIKQRIGEKGNTKNLINNAGVKKYTKSENSETVLDSEKIAKDKEWDGFHGVITNLKEESAEGILERYARLWKIEECFRINKHTLSMRPIYHFKPDRIHAHIALCYMAFSVLRYVEYVVRLTQKITPQEIIEELYNVQASIYHHIPTGKKYRMPGKFSHKASKIYKAFQIERRNKAQVMG